MNEGNDASSNPVFDPSTQDKGREAAYQQVRAHQTMLKAYALAIVRDPHFAEAAFQDIALEIARSWNEYDFKNPFESWSREVATRVCLLKMRKRDRFCTLDKDVLESLGSELDLIGDAEEMGCRKAGLQECLQKLPEIHYRLVRMRYFQNIPYPEISLALGKSINVIYMMLNRIHNELSSCLEKTGRPS